MKRVLEVGLCVLGVMAGLAGAVHAQWTARNVATVEGFQVPECVVVDETSGVAYVSNIVAVHDPNSREQYWAEDGTGFISRLKPDAQVDVFRWKESEPELPLNAPKGMCIARERLVVNDINHVVGFPLDDERPGRRIPVEGAMRLNDMATDGQAVYASDMAQGVVYRGNREGVQKLKAPEGVNGITFFDGRMYAVSRTLHDVYELDPSGQEEPKPFGIAEHFTGLDGIEVLDDGTFIVSDIAGNKVSTISPDRKSVRILLELESPADIGLDRKRMRLYVPQFMKDRVEVYQLEKR